MQILWSLDKAFVKDVLDKMPNPKPAYNTVSTIIRILEKKRFVGYESFGKSHRYFPLKTKEEYSAQLLSGVVDNYFKGSLKNLVSFFMEDNDLSVTELDEILKLLKEKGGKQ